MNDWMKETKIKEYILIKIELYHIPLSSLQPLLISLLSPQVNSLFSYIIVTYIHMCMYMYPQIPNYNLIKCIRKKINNESEKKKFFDLFLSMNSGLIQLNYAL